MSVSPAGIGPLHSPTFVYVCPDGITNVTTRYYTKDANDSWIAGLQVQCANGKNSPYWGGNSGVLLKDQSIDGYVNANGTYGYYTNGLGMARADGTTFYHGSTKGTKVTPEWGGCPAGQKITGVSGSAAGGVSGLKFHCAVPTKPIAPAPLIPSTPSPKVGGTQGVPYSFYCPSGRYITAVNGSAKSTDVTSLQFTCSDLTKSPLYGNATLGTAWSDVSPSGFVSAITGGLSKINTMQLIGATGIAAGKHGAATNSNPVPWAGCPSGQKISGAFGNTSNSLGVSSIQYVCTAPSAGTTTVPVGTPITTPVVPPPVVKPTTPITPTPPVTNPTQQSTTQQPTSSSLIYLIAFLFIVFIFLIVIAVVMYVKK